jgi:NADH-quinone oxidoreductase subunit E
MTKSGETRHESGAADRSAELGRMAVEMLQNSPLISMNPLMAQPAAAMAAATAIGFSVTTQMAGAFFGALQGAFDVTNRLAGSIDAQKEFAVAKPAAASAPSVRQPVVREPATAKRKAVAAKAAAVAKPAKPTVASRKLAVKADDLKRISGIGPKLEQVLNQRGIMAVADIAGWTEADVARIDAELGFEGRIGRDDWVGQAKLLTPKPSRRK